MARYNDTNINLEGVRIMGGPYRNFSGVKTPMNNLGDRNFCVALPENLVKRMQDDGLNVKFSRPRELDDGEIEPGTPFLKIKVNYNGFQPPKVIMITSRNEQPLGEKEIDLLDSSDILSADLIIHPNPGTFNGEPVMPLYLRALYVTIQEDYFEEKYARMREERRNKRAGD